MTDAGRDTAPERGEDARVRLPQLRLDELLEELQARIDAARGTRDRVRSLLEAVLSVGRELDLEQALHSIVEAAAALVDAQYAALGVIGPDGKRLSAFHTVGVSDEEIARIGHYPEGHGILGELIRHPRPLRVPKLSEHPASYGFPPHHPPMNTFPGGGFLRVAVHQARQAQGHRRAGEEQARADQERDVQAVDEGVAGGQAQRLTRGAAEAGRDLVRLAQRVRRRGGRGGRHPGDLGEPGRVGRVHHAAEQRDADARAELVGRLADGRRPAGLVLRGLAEHRLVGAEEGGLQAEAEQHEPAEQQRGVVVAAHGGQQHHRPGREAEAEGDHATRTEPAQHPGARQARGHRREGERHQPQPGLQRRQPQHQLEVLRGDQFEAHQGEHGQHDAADRGAERGPGEHPQVEQRMLAPALPADEQHQQDDPRGQRQQRGRAELARAEPLHPEDHREQPCGGRERADHVPGAAVAVALRLGQQDPPDGQADQHQRDVDQEDRAPPEVLQQEAAEQRSDRGAHGGDGAPDADGERPLTAVGEDLAQDRQRGRHDHRAADAEQRPRHDQQVRVVREGRHGRGHAEQGVAEEEDASAPDAVAQRAEQDQQRGTDQRIGVDDPEQFDRTGLEVLGDGGDGHVQHGGVDGDQQQADAEDDEHHPPVGTGPGRPTAQRGGRGRPGHVRTSQKFPRGTAGSRGGGLPRASAGEERSSPARAANGE